MSTNSVNIIIALNLKKGQVQLMVENISIFGGKTSGDFLTLTPPSRILLLKKGNNLMTSALRNYAVIVHIPTDELLFFVPVLKLRMLI